MHFIKDKVILMYYFSNIIESVQEIDAKHSRSIYYKISYLLDKQLINNNKLEKQKEDKLIASDRCVLICDLVIKMNNITQK